MNKNIDIKVEKIFKSKNNNIVYIICEKKDFKFQAWQFCMFDLINLKRAYSIASSPLDNFLWFYIKKASETGMSNYLTQKIKVWDKIKISWPYGHMKLEENKSTNYLFISTGSWFAPMISMYKTLVKSWNYNKIVNIFWERYKENTIDEILNEIKSYENENIKNIFYLSKENINWFKNWYVQSSIDEALKFLWKNKLNVYLCGKPAMVDENVKILKEKWIKNIYFEKY